jgi:hypothetical protein
MPFEAGDLTTPPRFKREQRKHIRTYHAHVRDELVCWTLKEKSPSLKALVGDEKDLSEMWDTLDTCYGMLEKYIAEVQEPMNKFRKYRIFEHIAVCKFYSLLWSAMIGAGGGGKPPEEFD